jgi:hypothetical protein
MFGVCIPYVQSQQGVGLAEVVSGVSREESKESKPLWPTPLADSNSPQGSTPPTASGWAPQMAFFFSSFKNYQELRFGRERERYIYISN